MTVYEFTKSLFDESLFPKRMTIETATEDLENFRIDGWELPEDITAEEYAEIWNGFLDNASGAWVCRQWIEDKYGWTSDFDRFETEAEAEMHGDCFLSLIRNDEEAREYEVYKHIER